MTWLNETAAAWADLFGTMLVQNTLWLLLIFLLLRLLRRTAARTRLTVATVGLLKLLIPPFLSLAAWGGSSGPPVPAQVSQLLFPFAGAQGAPEVVVSAAGGGLDLVAVVFLAWLVVAVCRLGWSILVTVDLRIRVQGAQRLPDEAVPSFVRQAGVQVRQTRAVGMPLTVGLRPRRIYVPGDWDRWTLQDRSAVLRHELAHIRHRDGVFRALEILVQAVYFFHPLVLLLVRRINLLREMACDDRSVTGHPRSRLAYSRFLVNLAETALARPVASESASTLIRRRSELMTRVNYQMKESAMRNLSKKMWGAVLLVLVLGALPLSVVHGQKQAPPPPPPPPPPKMEMVTVEMGPGVFTVDGRNTDFSRLVKDLEKAVAALEGPAVVAIKADRDLPVGKLHKLQQTLQEMALNKVVYLGDTGQKLALLLPTREEEKKFQALGEHVVVGLVLDDRGNARISGKSSPDQEWIPLARAVEMIAGMNAETPGLVVDLQARKDTPYQAMVAALDQLKKAGLKRIHMADPVE